MANGWWNGISKAIDVISGLAGGGRRTGEDPGGLEPRGFLGGIEARLAGVLVSALHEAFARDAQRMDIEREEAEASRRRAEAALRLEMARQQAEHHLSQLRAVVAIDIVVWLASLGVASFHPAAGVAKVLLGCAWAALTTGLGVAFVAYAQVSNQAALLAGVSPAAGLDHVDRAVPLRPRALDAASWLVVGGLALAAASAITSIA